MKHSSIVLRIILIAAFSICANHLNAELPSDEEMIKSVIKKFFIHRKLATSKKVEIKGIEIPQKTKDEVLEIIKECVSNRKGYFDKIKHSLESKKVNEKVYFTKSNKIVFNEFDFKFINIEGNKAFVGIDVFYDNITNLGHKIAHVFITDSNNDIIDVKEYEQTPREITIHGGYSYTFSLEYIDTNWMIVSEKHDFLPGYRP